MGDVVSLQRVEIREITDHDLANFVVGLVMMMADTGYRILPAQPDPYYLGGWVEHKMDDPLSRILIAEDDGRMVGMAGGSVVQFQMLAGFPHLWEWAMWVDPAYRHTGIGERLWDDLTRWARDNGAKGCVRGNSRATSEQTITETLHWRIWS